jgi:uncharacterized membrane protein
MTMKTDLKKLCLILYGVWVGSFLLLFGGPTMGLGTVAMLAGAGVAYAKRKEAAGTPFESHLTWLIRTFWIGTGVYLPVLMTVAMIAIWTQVDIPTLSEQVATGAVGSPEQLQKVLVMQYGPLMLALTIFLVLPFVGWWLWRCQRGYALAKEEKPVEKVKSWL